MTARTAIDTDGTADWSGCWCCGARKPEARHLRLGVRPQAGVCVECVAQLRQRARAHEDPPVLVRHLHRTANQVRDVVIAVGIHNHPESARRCAGSTSALRSDTPRRRPRREQLLDLPPDQMAQIK